jgi:hypothetical protein
MQGLRKTIKILRQDKRLPDRVLNTKSPLRVGSIEWINLAQDRDQWRAVVNTVQMR